METVYHDFWGYIRFLMDYAFWSFCTRVLAFDEINTWSLKRSLKRKKMDSVREICEIIDETRLCHAV